MRGYTPCEGSRRITKPFGSEVKGYTPSVDRQGKASQAAAAAVCVWRGVGGRGEEGVSVCWGEGVCVTDRHVRNDHRGKPRLVGQKYCICSSRAFCCVFCCVAGPIVSLALAPIDFTNPKLRSPNSHF